MGDVCLAQASRLPVSSERIRDSLICSVVHIFRLPGLDGIVRRVKLSLEASMTEENHTPPSHNLGEYSSALRGN